MSDQQLSKDLIQLNTKTLALKKNAKALDSIKEFISNSQITKLFLNSKDSLLLRTLISFIKNNSELSFSVVDGRNITNVMDSFRASVILNFRLHKDIYEGEVTGIKIMKDEAGNVHDIEVTLKTNKISASLKLDKYLFDVISQINIGDVVYIEPNMGIVKRIGRSENRLDEYDLEGDKYVQLSKGSVHSVKESNTTISLYDIDYAFNKYNEDISFFTRRHVDEIISEYMSSDIVQFRESCLFVENAQFLDRKSIVQLMQISDSYHSVKLVMSGDGSNMACSECLSGFFVLNLEDDEDVLDMVRYDCKKLEDEQFLQVVKPVISRNNHEMVLTTLNICKSPSEFNEIYSLQCSVFQK